jgi:uracil phosphoribosyltransferase
MPIPLSEDPLLARRFARSDMTVRPDVMRLGDPAADQIWERMQLEQVSVTEVTQAVHELTVALLDRITRHLGPSLSERLVPVVVLRGGLLMRQACREVLGDRPWGLVITRPRERGAPVSIAACDVPPAGGPVLLLDPVINATSGQG